MRVLHWSSRFKRSFKRIVKVHPGKRDVLANVLRRIAEDPYQLLLKTHKLHGKFEGTLACSVDYDLRILFEIIKNPMTFEEEILLEDIGTHDEVY